MGDNGKRSDGVITDRLRVIVPLMAEGFTDQEIAEHIHVSYTTVKDHLRKLYARLGAKNRAHAIHLAYQFGMLVVENELPEDRLRGPTPRPIAVIGPSPYWDDRL